MTQSPPISTLFPYTTLFRSARWRRPLHGARQPAAQRELRALAHGREEQAQGERGGRSGDRKSTRLNSSHMSISYAVFCLKKKNSNKNNFNLNALDIA